MALPTKAQTLAEIFAIADNAMGHAEARDASPEVAIRLYEALANIRDIAA